MGRVKPQPVHVPQLTAGQQRSAIVKAFEQRGISAMGKLVLIQLCLYADQDSLCFPGQKRLADALDTSDRTVRSAIAELKAAGLVAVVRRGRNNLYRLNFWNIQRDFPVDNSDDAVEKPVDNMGKEDEQRKHASYIKRKISSGGIGREDIGKALRPVGSRQSVGKTMGVHSSISARPAPKTFLSSAWYPTDQGAKFARALGMTADQLQIEVSRFINHYDENRISSNDWNGVWSRWCRSWNRWAVTAGAKELAPGRPGSSRLDAHPTMTFARFRDTVGFNGHMRAIAVEAGVDDPESAWSRFVNDQASSPPIQASRWPCVFRKFCQKHS